MRLLTFVIYFLDSIFIIIFVAAYLALYIHPRYVWWLQLMAPTLPLLSIGLLIIVGMTALFSKWVFFGIHLPLLLLAGIRLGIPQFGTPGAALSDGQSITVMTFNAKNHYKNYSVSAKVMQKLIEQEQPDMIGLQEVGVWFLDDSRSRGSDYHIRALFQEYRITRPEKTSTNRPYRLNQPIFSKYDCSLTPLHTYSDGMDSQVSLNGTRGQVTWQGRQFAIYNIHLRSFSPEANHAKTIKWRITPSVWFRTLKGSKEDFLVRAKEAEQLRQLLEEETLPFIVLGDFNSTPHNWVYGHIAEGLFDTYKVAGRGWGASFPSHFPIFRIDYILTSPDWRIVSAQTSISKFSDHLPFVAKLVLPVSE